MLFVVATPIGNLKDITLRAIETLADCDYILAEDTRQSVKLLQHFGIEKRLVSFHEHNEVARGDEVVEDLKKGLKVALVSDAGTPLISDPGERLVRRCIDEGLEVTTTPGPCAVIAALTLAGLDAAPFQFVGFLPRKSKEALRELLEYPGTSIAYESPQRITDTLEAIRSIDPARKVVVARELTKKFETVYRGTAEEVSKALTDSPKGEIVLLIAKQIIEKAAPNDAAILELIAEMKQNGNSLKDAATVIADRFGLSKRYVYQLAVANNNC